MSIWRCRAAPDERLAQVRPPGQRAFGDAREAGMRGAPLSVGGANCN